MILFQYFYPCSAAWLSDRLLPIDKPVPGSIPGYAVEFFLGYVWVGFFSVSFANVPPYVVFGEGPLHYADDRSGKAF